ncbi:hypothetical protein ABK040_010500 [Willaertia magna]
MDTYASHLWILRKANNNTKIVALYVPNEATEDDFTIVAGETYYNAEEQKENIKAERAKSRMMKTITKMYNNNVNNEKDPPLEGLKSINVGGFVSQYCCNSSKALTWMLGGKDKEIGWQKANFAGDKLIKESKFWPLVESLMDNSKSAVVCTSAENKDNNNLVGSNGLVSYHGYTIVEYKKFPTEGIHNGLEYLVMIQKNKISILILRNN